MENEQQDRMARLLREALERVTDEATFRDFLEQLAADWLAEREIEGGTPSSPYASGVLGWESGSIGDFLDASCRWAHASKDGLTFYPVPENPWRRAADILMMGKIYE